MWIAGEEEEPREREAKVEDPKWRDERGKEGGRRRARAS
jgi:hypothetical protein